MSLRMRDIQRIESIEDRGFEECEKDDFEFLVSTLKELDVECVNAEDDRERLTCEIDDLEEQVRELS